MLAGSSLPPVAWSAGCVIMPSPYQRQLNANQLEAVVAQLKQTQHWNSSVLPLHVILLQIVAYRAVMLDFSRTVWPQLGTCLPLSRLQSPVRLCGGAVTFAVTCYALCPCRCNRRISSLETKLAATAAGSSAAELEQKLAAARQQQVELQQQLETAEAARDAEAARLAEEDAQVEEAAAAAAGDQVLPVVSDQRSDEGNSDTGSPAATALVSDVNDCSKDTDLAIEMQQQQHKGTKGWLSNLRKK